ncbi:hypothetical protein [Halococcus agarilyticus]|uniref:hypothetical protein n=1 Tax=Halococcus agarilyticus TaxID=1232219 RepID=UPI000677CD6B|nr:hypothetical protein [Halococcus agarilyticus]
MDAATEGGLFTGGFGLLIIAIGFWTNDNPFALFTGVSPTGTPVVPLLAIVIGALLVLYGILSVVGVLPDRYEWQAEGQ